MTALDEFYETYLHYSVSQRLFEDRCRQLTECDGTVSERQALVDETLRLAMCVTNSVIDLEPLLSEAADELRNDGGDRDLLKALSLISNSIREDRDRADSYTLFVTARRSGNTMRRPRRPRVANPFEFVEEEDEEVVAPAPAYVPAREKPKPVVPVEEPEDEEDPVEEEEEETEEQVAEEPEEEPTSDVVPKPNEDPVETEEEPAPVVGPVPPAPDDRSIDEDPVEDESEKPEDTAEDEEISDEPEDPSEDNESRSFLDSIRDFFGRILKR